MPVTGLNILFTTAHFPYPLIGGDRIKQYNILKHLSKNHNVHVVAFDRWFPIEKEYIAEVEKLGIKSIGIKMNSVKAYLNGAFFSPFGHPLEIEFFRDSRFRKAIEGIIKQNKIDLAMSHFLRTAEYIKELECRKILFAEDCRSHFQRRTYLESRNLKQRAIRYYESKKLRKYESDITNYFDITTMVTNEDVNLMKKLNPDADIRVLSNGVDVQKFQPAVEKTLRKDIVFTSKLDMWVNDLMLERITGSIFPRILNDIPAARLHIVGASPQKKHYQLQSDNILLHADVPEITPYLQKGAVYIHPHIGGSGIQNKVLEAMACGCPVITTKSGSRGIDFRHGEESFVLESDDEIANQAINLLKDNMLVEKISTKARNYILENFQWNGIFQELDNIIDELFDTTN